jgi:hypothetical protein
MTHKKSFPVLGLFLIVLGFIGVKAEDVRPQSLVARAALPANGNRSLQELGFIRECLAVGFRPTILLELENKALTDAKGTSEADPILPSKVQLKDLRDSFRASATKLHEMANSPAAGKMASFAQRLEEARTKQDDNCSRLPDSFLHEEGIGQMMIELVKISLSARTEQDADRKAGEYSKQHWPDLVNLPVQQKQALKEILDTEQQFQRIRVELAKDSELQSEVVLEGVIQELQSRAKKIADNLTPEAFYATLLGTGLPNPGWTLEAGEMTRLEVTQQKIIGHCIISKIHLEVRGKSGKTAAVNLIVVHETYADGRLALMQVIK